MLQAAADPWRSAESAWPDRQSSRSFSRNSPYSSLCMANHLPIQIPVERVAAFCERHGVARLSLFGSVLREDFSPASDVDVLVEFLPARIPDLFAMVRLQEELSSMLGRAVDLRTPRELSRHFRARVMAEARVLHAA